MSPPLHPPPFRRILPHSPPGRLRVGPGGRARRAASQALSGRGAVQTLVLKLEVRIRRGGALRTLSSHF